MLFGVDDVVVADDAGAATGTSFCFPLALAEGAFQYKTIWSASTALSANPAMNPYRMSLSSTSCSVVKMRVSEPRR